MNVLQKCMDASIIVLTRLEVMLVNAELDIHYVPMAGPVKVTFWSHKIRVDLPCVTKKNNGWKCVVTGTCGGVIKASNGTLSSPNFPMNYPPMRNCVWQIEADDEYQIIVNFTHFDVEGMKSACSYDYVLVQNDKGAEERYCGHYNSLVYTSTTNRIQLHFVSDNTVCFIF